MDAADLKLYPTWRELEKQLLDAGLKDGAVLAMDLLRAGLGLRDPRQLPGEEAIREQAAFNFAIGELKESLLTNHRIALHLVPSVGYVVVPPEEQTQLAMRDGSAELSATLRRASMKVIHVRSEMLSDQQRKENADAQAKLAFLSSMVSRRLKKNVGLLPGAA